MVGSGGSGRRGGCRWEEEQNASVGPSGGKVVAASGRWERINHMPADVSGCSDACKWGEEKVGENYVCVDSK